MPDGTCTEPGCETPARTRGLCNTHYVYAMRHGLIVPLPVRTIEERFWAFVDRTDTCWLWTGSKNRDGYGQFGIAAKTQVYAHRWAYGHFVGPIPAAHEIDHLCRNRACVNPAHLEPVTRAENVRRSENPPAVNARKTHCVNGHEFTPENTALSAAGYRRCRTCSNSDAGRTRSREYQRAKRAALSAVPTPLACPLCEGSGRCPTCGGDGAANDGRDDCKPCDGKGDCPWCTE